MTSSKQEGRKAAPSSQWSDPTGSVQMTPNHARVQATSTDISIYSADNSSTVEAPGKAAVEDAPKKKVEEAPKKDVRYAPNEEVEDAAKRSVNAAADVYVAFCSLVQSMISVVQSMIKTPKKAAYIFLRCTVAIAFVIADIVFWFFTPLALPLAFGTGGVCVLMIVGSEISANKKMFAFGTILAVIGLGAFLGLFISANVLGDRLPKLRPYAEFRRDWSFFGQ